MTTTAQAPLIRPAWTPATIGLMVLGFIIFPPLGLVMLAYIIWGDRWGGLKHGIDRAAGDMRCAMKRGMPTARASTGNVAFDEWRDAELDRLAEERRKLDEMRDEFDAYSRDLRRAKDQKEFDRFMAARKSGKADDETIIIEDQPKKGKKAD